MFRRLDQWICQDKTEREEKGLSGRQRVRTGMKVKVELSALV